jgi:predicted O-linked N-acetylglucosamine transferase (SPINDLY family)
LGDGHASRVGGSLLASAGLPELIASSDDEYVRIAVRLISNRPQLAIYRRELPARFASSIVCDEHAFVRRFERILLEMWGTRTHAQRP